MSFSALAVATGCVYDELGLLACDSNTCGLRSDGGITCWGTLDARRFTPPSGTFVSISAGDQFICAARQGGGVECWGALVRPLALDLP